MKVQFYGIIIDYYRRIKFCLSQGNRAAWVLFILFAFTIFLKVMIFHWNSFHTILLSSAFNAPHEFIRFWGGKIIPALFLGSFVFICRNRIWMVCTHVLIDIWLIANIFYYNANTLFLSYETMQMADNMSGFWDSLYSYIDGSMKLYPIITLCFIMLLFFIPKPSKRKPIFFSIVLTFTMLIAVVDNICYRVFWQSTTKNNEASEQVMEKLLTNEDFHYYYPFGNVYFWAKIEDNTDYNVWATNYVKDYSIISYFPACFIYSWLAPAGEIIELSSDDEARIQPFVQGHISDSVPTPQNNIIFILFESLESWPIGEVCGYQYMPNLTKLSQSEHALYCDKITSQVRHGNSADGQMIDATGILPISNGATCRLYYNNIFPSYAQCYAQSAIINPASGMWNQSKMTFDYQFKQLIEPKNGEGWDDAALMKQVYNYADTVSAPFCVMGITVTSHVPFAYGAEHPKYSISDMPAIMSAYLNCLYYTDSIIGDFVKAVYSNEKLASNTMIVISGDHTIFRSHDGDMDDFARSHGIGMRTTKTYTPLIIYSPLIESNSVVNEVCYQMDIYPTILSLIGCDDYFWKGVGDNLMDHHNRTIQEVEAFELSDKIIRSNYFSTH